MLYERGDLLSATSGVIVHGANAHGIMSSGVAKVIKEKYPDAYKKYVLDIELFKVGLGKLSVHRVTPDLVVVSAITQYNYGRDPSIRYMSYDAMDSCFDRLFKATPKECIIHTPKIGCGLGGGNWNVVSAIIQECAIKNDFDHDQIIVYSF